MSLPAPVGSGRARFYKYNVPDLEGFECAVEVTEPLTLSKFATHSYIDPSDGQYWDENELDDYTKGKVVTFSETPTGFQLRLPYRHMCSELARVIHVARLTTYMSVGELRTAAPTERMKRSTKTARRDFSLSRMDFERFRREAATNGWLVRDGSVDIDQFQVKVGELEGEIRAFSRNMADFRARVCLGSVGDLVVTTEVAEAAHDQITNFISQIGEFSRSRGKLAKVVSELANEYRRERDTQLAGQAMEGLNKLLESLQSSDSISFDRMRREVDSRLRQANPHDAGRRTLSLRLDLSAELGALKEHFPSLRYLTVSSDSTLHVEVAGVRISFGKGTIKVTGDLEGLERYKQERTVSTDKGQEKRVNRMKRIRRRRSQPKPE